MGVVQEFELKLLVPVVFLLVVTLIHLALPRLRPECASAGHTADNMEIFLCKLLNLQPNSAVK